MSSVPSTRPGLIENPDEKRDRIRAELTALKEHMEAEKNAAESAKTAIETSTEENQKAEKTAQLRARVETLRTRIEGDIARWRETIGEGNEAVQEKLAAFETELLGHLDAIEDANAAVLLERVEALRQRVEQAEKEDNDDEETFSKGLEDLTQAEVSDIIEHVEEEVTESGFMGMIQKLGKILEPLMKMFAKVRIMVSEMMIKLNFRLSPEEKQQAQNELDQAKNEYAAQYAGEDLRALFAAQVGTLGRRLVIKPGMMEGRAVRRFEELYQHNRRSNPNLKREDLVAALLAEYAEKCGVEEEAFTRAEYSTTLWGILNGEKPQAGVESADLVGAAQSIEIGGTAYQVEVRGNEIVVNGESKTLQLKLWAQGAAENSATAAPVEVKTAQWLASGEIDFTLAVNFMGHHESRQLLSAEQSKDLLEKIANRAVPDPIVGTTSSMNYRLNFV